MSRDGGQTCEKPPCTGHLHRDGDCRRSLESREPIPCQQRVADEQSTSREVPQNASACCRPPLGYCATTTRLRAPAAVAREISQPWTQCVCQQACAAPAASRKPVVTARKTSAHDSNAGVKSSQPLYTCALPLSTMTRRPAAPIISIPHAPTVDAAALERTSLSPGLHTQLSRVSFNGRHLARRRRAPLVRENEPQWHRREATMAPPRGSCTRACRTGHQPGERRRTNRGLEIAGA